MPISTEFELTVFEKNILKTRIMLKDSLLVDKSFSLFSELLNYAIEHDVQVWKTSDSPLEIAQKPWTIDLLNYELTSLVNNFTKEHVKYVKQIIKYIYGGDVTQNDQAPHEVRREYCNPDIVNSSLDICYKTILQRVSFINKILQENRNVYGSRRWLYKDIERIQKSANEIEKACDYILRRQ